MKLRGAVALAIGSICLAVLLNAGCATLKALRADPIPPEVGAGAKLLHEGKDEAAMAEFDKAIAKDPSSALVYAMIAQEACVQLNRPAMGLRYAEQGLKAAPKATKLDRARLNVAAANACAGLGNYAKAVEYNRAALELAPDSAEQKNNLAYTLAELGANQNDLEEALGLAKQAVEAARDDPNSKEEGLGIYLDTLGWVYFKLSRYSDAASALAQAADLAPMYPDIHYHLARAYKADGKDDQAHTALDRAESALQSLGGPKPQLRALISELRAQLPPRPQTGSRLDPPAAMPR